MRSLFLTCFLDLLSENKSEAMPNRTAWLLHQHRCLLQSHILYLSVEIFCFSGLIFFVPQYFQKHLFPRQIIEQLQR